MWSRSASKSSQPEIDSIRSSGLKRTASLPGTFPLKWRQEKTRGAERIRRESMPTGLRTLPDSKSSSSFAKKHVHHATRSFLSAFPHPEPVHNGDSLSFSHSFRLAFDESGNVRRPKHPALSFCLSHNGKRILVTFCEYPYVLCFNDQGQFVRRLGRPGDTAGRFREPTGLCVNNTTCELYVMDRRRGVSIWDTRKGQFLREYTTMTGLAASARPPLACENKDDIGPDACALSRDGRRLYFIRSSKPHHLLCADLTKSGESKLFISKVYALPISGQETYINTGHSLALSPDERFVYFIDGSGSGGSKAALWQLDTTTGRVTPILYKEGVRKRETVDGQMAQKTTDIGSVLQSLHLKDCCKPRLNYAQGLCMSPSGDYLYIGDHIEDSDDIVLVVRRGDWRPVTQAKGHREEGATAGKHLAQLKAVVFSAVSNQLLVLKEGRERQLEMSLYNALS